MKEYKLVSYNGNVQEGNTQAEPTIQSGNVYKTFGGETGNVNVGGIGKVGGDFGVNVGAINGQVGTTENVGNTPNSALPKKIGLWGKVRNFLFQEIDLNKKVVLELTPKEEKVLKEVRDFWLQDIHFPELHDFLFQEITIFGKKNKQK